MPCFPFRDRLFSKGGEITKRSEFSEIVNAVAKEELKRLVELVNNCNEDEDPNVKIFAAIPDIAARSAAEIMIKSGLIQFDPEASD